MFPVESGRRLFLHRHGRVVEVVAHNVKGVGRNGFADAFRLFVEVHDLRHGGSYASRVGQFVAVVRIVGVHELRTIIPIGCSLVPLGSDKWGNGVARVHACFSGGAHCLCSFEVVHLVESLQLIGIAVEPIAHVVGHVSRIDGSLVAVGKDGFSTVVTRDDDESVAIAYIKYIIIGFVAIAFAFQCLRHGRRLHQLFSMGRRLFGHECCGLFHGLFTTDGSCESVGGDDQAEYDEKFSHNGRIFFCFCSLGVFGISHPIRCGW